MAGLCAKPKRDICIRFSLKPYLAKSLSEQDIYYFATHSKCTSNQNILLNPSYLGNAVFKEKKYKKGSLSVSFIQRSLIFMMPVWSLLKSDLDVLVLCYARSFFVPLQMHLIVLKPACFCVFI